MIKKKRNFLLLFCMHMFHASENSTPLLKKIIEKNLNKINDALLTQDLSTVPTAYEPLNELLPSLKGMPHTENSKNIVAILSHLKSEIYGLKVNEDQPFNYNAALQIKVGYCKLIYACFELHNKDIKNKMLPLKNVFSDIKDVLGEYMYCQTNQYHQAFPGFIDYTLLQTSIDTFVNKIAHPNTHLFLAIDMQPVKDLLEKLSEEINDVENKRNQNELNINVPVDTIYNAYYCLNNLLKYVESKQFLCSLPMIHAGFPSPVDNFCNLIVGQNDQFKTTFEYTYESGKQVLDTYVFDPCKKLKGLVNSRNNVYKLYRIKFALSYFINPLDVVVSSYTIKKTQEESFLNPKNKIKQVLTAEISDSLETGKQYFKEIVNGIQAEADSLQVDLEKKFFNPVFLEKLLQGYFVASSIAKPSTFPLSLIDIIFLPQTIINNQKNSNTCSIESAVHKVIDTQVDPANRDLFNAHIVNIKLDWCNDYCKKLDPYKLILNKTVYQDLLHYLNINDHVFIYDVSYFKEIYYKFGIISADMNNVMNDLIKTKNLVEERIVDYKNKIVYEQRKKNKLPTLAKVTALLDAFLGQNSLELRFNKFIDELKKDLEQLDLQIAKANQFVKDIELVQNTLTKYMSELL